jgi:two-component system sensor histidine kinase DesK
VVFPFIVQARAVLGEPALSWALWATGLVAFLALYFRGYAVDGSGRVPVIVALGALGAALSPINPGALMFFTYATAFVGGAVRSSRAGIWIGALTLTGVATAAVTWGHPLLISAVAMMTPIIGFANLHYVETRRRDASLRLAQEEIARLAALAERERIAGDLHDLLGQTLSVIVLKSELATKLVTRDPDRAGAEIREVERVSRDALSEVRRAVDGFRSATLTDELVRARAVLGAARIGVDLEAPAAAGDARAPLPREVEHAIAMILREAVTNVVRHSQALRCRITLTRDDEHLQLRVEDDGVGDRIVAGAGVESMRARAREIGAALDHHVARGVIVTLRVPVGAAR